MTAPTLTRRLRARQSAARCDRLAANADTKAALYPTGSIHHADWLALAAGFRTAADDWRAVVDELTPAEDPPLVGCPCGGNHPEEEHATLAALDDDADAYFDRP